MPQTLQLSEHDIPGPMPRPHAGMGRRPHIAHRPGAGKVALSCWLARPHAPAADRAPLVAIHGVRRGARAQAQAFARAAQDGRTVVAPLFSETDWRGYQQVVLKKRADLALLELLRDLRLCGAAPGGRIRLVGYSAGGQFAHRFALIYPHLIESLTVVSAGWYTFPDPAPFPYGLGDAGRWGRRIETRLTEFLKLPITVAVGAEDTARDALTRQGPDLDAQQGRNRYERAERWHGRIHKLAKAHGVGGDRIRFAPIPDAGHDFGECVAGGLVDLVLPTHGP